MGALELDEFTWADVEAELQSGRDTVVLAFGATEQHSLHLPLATDALLGDHLARLVADRLNAFIAPTVRIGCSSHHLDFAGTISLEEETFHAVVADHVRSFARTGFKRAVLLPTHGGNFGPLGAALAKLGPVDDIVVQALTDVSALLELAQIGEREHGVPIGEGGLHAGEWETSMLLAIRPDLVHMDRGEPGFTGNLEEALQGVFSGIKTISENGAIGDPAQSSAEHGQRYWDAVLELALAEIGEGD
jgi:creatinine amidohydrolase